MGLTLCQGCSAVFPVKFSSYSQGPEMAILVLTLNLRWSGLNFLGLHSRFWGLQPPHCTFPGNPRAPCLQPGTPPTSLSAQGARHFPPWVGCRGLMSSAPSADSRAQGPSPRTAAQPALRQRCVNSCRQDLVLYLRRFSTKKLFLQNLPCFALLGFRFLHVN